MDKNNYEDIVAKKAQIEAELLKKPGIHTVAIGYKEVEGKPTNELAIVVFTTKKKPIEEMDADEIVPEFYEGIPTDVVELPEFEYEMSDSNPDKTRYRPASGGVQLGNSVTDGSATLGIYVKSKKAGDNESDVYILSNKHVLKEAGTSIYQPYNDSPDNKIAVTTRGDYYKKADAAIAKMNDKTKAAVGVIQDVGYVGGTYNVVNDDIGKKVKKRGRTTRFTRGVIKYINTTYDSYEDQILIYSLGSDVVFNMPGDSGSVIMMDTADNLIISLHWGGIWENDIKVSISSPIKHVCDALEIEVILPK